MVTSASFKYLSVQRNAKPLNRCLSSHHFLPKLGELDVPFRAAERNAVAWDSSGERKESGIFLSELLGGVFKVLVPNLS